MVLTQFICWCWFAGVGLLALVCWRWFAGVGFDHTNITLNISCFVNETKTPFRESNVMVRSIYKRDSV
jgi:hypothetical protein